MTARSLIAGGQRVALPAFFPVTTFGGKFPLDDLVRPYLSRLAPGVMVSYHYAKKMKRRPAGVVFIDSGGFASLFEGSQAIDLGEFAVIKTKEGDEITPADVLAFQEKHADIGATVDFLIPPDMSTEDAGNRQALTLKNALWAIRARKRPSLLLYASVQAWDAESATRMTQELNSEPFDGYALGGMVPRISRPDEIVDIVRAIRAVDSQRPLHVFGIGNPRLMRVLLSEGVDSFDSSSYLRAAVDGRTLDSDSNSWTSMASHESEQTPCSCAICRTLPRDYLSLESEANRMALALHNLDCLISAVSTVNRTGLQDPTVEKSTHRQESLEAAKSPSRRRATARRAV
jgi:tRNA-guanine family transglycosylase